MIFFQKNPTNLIFFEGVKVREDWLELANLFYKESKSKKNIYFFFFFFFFFGGGRG